MKKRIIAAVAVFGLLGGILYFAYAQTAAQNNVKHFTAFFAVEGESIDQNNDIKKEIARLTGAFLGSKAPLNSYKLEKMTKNLTFSNEKARKELGWEPLDVLTNYKI